MILVLERIFETFYCFHIVLSGCERLSVDLISPFMFLVYELFSAQNFPCHTFRLFEGCR